MEGYYHSGSSRCKHGASVKVNKPLTRVYCIQGENGVVRFRNTSIKACLDNVRPSMIVGIIKMWPEKCPENKMRVRYNPGGELVISDDWGPV